jgi:hypothetical protein
MKRLDYPYAAFEFNARGYQAVGLLRVMSPQHREFGLLSISLAAGSAPGAS